MYSSALGSTYIPPNPRSYVKTSSNRNAIIKVLPDRLRWIRYLQPGSTKSTGIPHCIAYKLEEDDALTKLWEMQEWYAFHVFLSNDGQYLVEVSGPVGNKPSEENIALRFYKNGKLIKKYSTGDIKSRIQR